MNLSSYGAIAALVLVGASLVAAPVLATSYDRKSVDATSCEPYGPGTVAAELNYNQLGITNPGTTNESVMCPLSTDSETAWASTPGTTGLVTVYYRAGATPGRVACTAFVSKASMSAGAVYSITSNPVDSSANARGSFIMNLADTSTDWGMGPPLVLLCTLTPKATLGGIYLQELAPTNSP